MGALGDQQTKAAAVLYRRKAVKAACFLSNADKTLKRGLQFFFSQKKYSKFIVNLSQNIAKYTHKRMEGHRKGNILFRKSLLFDDIAGLLN